MRVLFNRNDWWYRVGFAVVKWTEATIELALLGQVSLGWSLEFARIYAKFKFRRANGGRKT